LTVKTVVITSCW